MTVKKVVTFGEIMLRLSPPEFKRIVQTDLLEASYGGGEANVAVSLANFGIESTFVTRLPENLIGEAARNQLRRYGVDTSAIQWGGDRIGIYFAEKGASQRPSVVVYDRANSAVSEVKVGDLPWKDIFKGKDWFHFTGITPALGSGPAEVTLEAAKTAKAMGLTVSCDLNYRKKLWSPEEAGRVMAGLMEYVDIAVGNEEDAEKVFGVKAVGTDIVAGKLQEEAYYQVMRELCSRFKLKAFAITLRESISASQNGWSALYYNGSDFFKSKKYQIEIVDRVGGGDSFCGGLIYTLLMELPLQEALDFAVAASCLKQAIHNDFNHVSIEEVLKLAGGDASGRVQR
jgi:2-dehydro-3-deoxygluconokinase